MSISDAFSNVCFVALSANLNFIRELLCEEEDDHLGCRRRYKAPSYWPQREQYYHTDKTCHCRIHQQPVRQQRKLSLVIYSSSIVPVLHPGWLADSSCCCLNGVSGGLQETLQTDWEELVSHAKGANMKASFWRSKTEILCYIKKPAGGEIVKFLPDQRKIK